MKYKLTNPVRLAILVLASGCCLYSCKCNEEPLITSFVFNELSPPATGEISHEDGTILVEVPALTDVTNLSPTIDVGNPNCHTLSPLSGIPRDFSSPVIYEVTNEVEDTRQYEVSVTFDNPVASLGITWESKAPLPALVGWMPAVELDGKIYVIGGGLNATDVTDKMYVYDPATDTWDDTRASLPKGRFAHAAEAVNGKLYVMGGVTGAISNALDDIQVYDPLTDTWQSAGSMPIRRAAFGSCVIDDQIYLVGGELEEPTTNVLDDVSVYDPATGNWTTLAPLPTARCYLTAEAVNGKIYAAGGTTESPWQGSDIHEIYDPASDTWIEAAPMTKGLWALGSCVIDDNIIFGGGTPVPMTAGSSEIQIYSVTQEKWYKGTNLEFPRLASPICELEGRIYVIGGAVSAAPWATNTNDLTVGLPDF